MADTHKGEKFDKIVNSTSSVGGGIVGGMVGLSGGPIGVVLGAIAGSLVEKVFIKAGKEIRERILSNSEENKITTVYDLAKEKIKNRLDAGEKIRDDGFFDTDGTTRSKADEVFEDLMFAAQREAEEKKLPLMANLFSNIVFNKTISKEEAHQLIKVAEKLSYRQFVIMQIIAFNYTARKMFGKLHSLSESPREGQYGTISGYENISILSEILDLYRKSIIHSETVIFDVASINPSSLFLVGIGVQLYKLMALNELPLDDIGVAISKTLAIKT